MTTTAIATTTGPASASEWAALQQQAALLARSKLVPAALRGKPDDVLLVVLAGRELGIGPVMALSRIYIVDGTPALSAEAMRALVLRAGHRLQIVESSDQHATVAGCRGDDPENTTTVTWTLDDAQRAGLASKGTWKTYPRAMLLARATSELCRAMFADVLSGLTYLPEELGADVDADGQPVIIDADPVDQTAQGRAAVLHVVTALGVDRDTLDADIAHHYGDTWTLDDLDVDQLRDLYRRLATAAPKPGDVDATA